MQTNKKFPSKTKFRWTLSMNAVLRRLVVFYEWLNQPVHPSSLCLFRCLYAYVMAAQTLKWIHMFTEFQVCQKQSFRNKPHFTENDRDFTLSRSGMDSTCFTHNRECHVRHKPLLFHPFVHRIFYKNGLHYQFLCLWIFVSHLSLIL